MLIKPVIYSSSQKNFGVVMLKIWCINGILVVQMLTESEHLITQDVNKNILDHVRIHCSQWSQFIIRKTPAKQHIPISWLEPDLAHIRNVFFHMVFAALDDVRHFKKGENVIRQTTLYSASQLLSTFCDFIAHWRHDTLSAYRVFQAMESSEAPDSKLSLH